MGLELILKSFILFEKGQFKGIHSLNKLVAEITEHSPQVSFSNRELQVLNYLSNFEELRYPNRKKPIELGAEDFNLIEELANAIWLQLPVELVEAFEALPKNKKGGRVLMARPKEVPRDLKFETGIDEKET